MNAFLCSMCHVMLFAEENNLKHHHYIFQKSYFYLFKKNDPTLSSHNSSKAEQLCKQKIQDQYLVVTLFFNLFFHFFIFGFSSVNVCLYILNKSIKLLFNFHHFNFYQIANSVQKYSHCQNKFRY